MCSWCYEPSTPPICSISGRIDLFKLRKLGISDLDLNHMIPIYVSQH